MSKKNDLKKKMVTVAGMTMKQKFIAFCLTKTHWQHSKRLPNAPQPKNIPNHNISIGGVVLYERQK